jgi:hypothetical protein
MNEEKEKRQQILSNNYAYPLYLYIQSNNYKSSFKIGLQLGLK